MYVYCNLLNVVFQNIIIKLSFIENRKPFIPILNDTFMSTFLQNSVNASEGSFNLFNQHFLCVFVQVSAQILCA